MKKFLISIILLSAQNIYAHCPIPFVDKSGDYCMDLEWQNGERNVKGQWEVTDQMSPYINKENEIPQKWIYSKVLIRTWKNGDKTHVPVVFPNFRVFPYMTMADGMHHVASYQLSYDETAQAYVLSQFALQEMAGCWSLRQTTEAADDLTTSQLVLDLCNGQAPPEAKPGTEHHHH